MLSYKEENNLAISYGFTPQLDSSGDWYFFIKSNIIIWATHKGWCRASRKILLDKNIIYQEHREFNNLEDALKYND